jgi:pimeloyl-ACP methyl ester carboxylesterase
MAKLMSKKTRETVTTTAVLVLIVLFVAFYIIYPLVTVRKATGRPDGEEFDDPAFTLENDAAFFNDRGFRPDTFEVTTDDNIRLAALYFHPDSTAYDSVRGAAVLIHSSDSDRTSLSAYLSPLLDSGLSVILYDQRACGLSGGRYHAGGVYEGDDLNRLIVHLKFRGLIPRPLFAVGFELGADAAIYASEEEMRIDEVIAVSPRLTTNLWITRAKEDHGLLSIPFSRMVYFWWYKKITGFPLERTGPDDIQPVPSKTLLIMSQTDLDSEEAAVLKESSGDLISTLPMPEDENLLRDLILEEIYRKLR